MRRIIPLSLLALTLVGGVALADRDRQWGGRDRDRGGDRRGGDRQDRRDHRDNRDRHSGGVVVRDHRDHRGPVVVRDHNHHRRPIARNRVYVNNGHYVFGGNVRRTYVRPVIRHRYYDVRVRPVVLVEQMEPVPGYVWVRGNWNWSGYEWVWVSGHYQPDPRYSTWYDDGTGEFAAGVSVSGGVSVGF